MAGRRGCPQRKEQAKNTNKKNDCLQVKERKKTKEEEEELHGVVSFAASNPVARPVRGTSLHEVIIWGRGSSGCPD